MNLNRGTADINYLILLLVIVVGVVIGNLISNWITTKVVAIGVEQAVANLSKSTAEATKRARDAAVTQAQKAASVIAPLQDEARGQRRRDREGVRLAQSCEEWRRAHAQLNSDTTKTEMRKHCDIYDRYVQHGVLPQEK
jgi:ABC-type microcin C transport system permease subunit YejB